MPVNVPSGQNISTALQANDAIALERGGTYTGGFSIPRNNISITAFGDPAKPLPVVNGGIKEVNGKSNISIDSVKFDGQQQHTFGLRFVNSNNVRLDKIKVVNFGGNGVDCEGFNKRVSGFILTNSLVANNFPPPGNAHCQGLYAASTDGIVLTGNVFSTNGGAPGTETKFNHNVYLHASNGPARVEFNVFHKGCSHGLQQRCGGNSRWNIFVDNAVHQSYGLVNGSDVHKGGVSGTIERNVYVGGKGIAGSPRGWCLELSQVAPSPSGVVAQDLLMSGDTQNSSKALHVVPCDNDIHNPADVVDPSKWHLALTNISVWSWPPGALEIKAGNPTRTNVGNPPPTQKDLRAVLGDFVTRGTNGETQKMVEECFAAVGLPITPTLTIFPPAHLKAAKEPTRVKLTWDKVPNATYKMYRNGTMFGTSTDEQGFYTAGTSGSFSVTSVINGAESQQSAAVTV